MKCLKQSVSIEHMTDDPLRLITLAAKASRFDSQSAYDMYDDDLQKFVARRIYDDHHGTVLEHAHMTARFIMDRGIADELVRHRLISPCMSSTRVCNYSKDRMGGEISVIVPTDFTDDILSVTQVSLELSESAYMKLIDKGVKPERARLVLPFALAAELVITANFREWRKIFALRTDKAAHPDLRKLMQELLDQARKRVPVVFDRIGRAD